MIDQEFVTRLTLLERKVDGLVKPEIPLGLSLISTIVLTGSATTIAFSSIPQTFRSLLMIIRSRTDRATEVDNVLIRLNNDSGANYDTEFMTANGVTASATPTRATAASIIALSEAANSRAANFGPGYIFIPDYASASAEKQILALSANFGDASADADLFARFIALRWRSIVAVTSIILVPNVGPNFVAGSGFQLYGIL